MNARSSLGTAVLLLIAAKFSWADCPPGYYQKTISIAHHVVSRYCVANGRVVITAPLSLVTGPVLAGWIQESRNSAYGASLPVPPSVRAVLEQWGLSDDILNVVRFKVGDNGVVNLGRVANAVGDINAITLIDVIVFHSPAAAGDYGTWAHEMVHVQQYRARGGVLNFATEYAANYQALEKPAYDAQNQFNAWIEQQGLVMDMPAPEGFTPVDSGPAGVAPPGFVVSQYGPGGGNPGGLSMPCGCYGSQPTNMPIDAPQCRSGSSVAALCQGVCPDGNGPFKTLCR
jgi:Domain of unknown function (DUF4157)